MTRTLDINVNRHRLDGAGLEDRYNWNLQNGERPANAFPVAS